MEQQKLTPKEQDILADLAKGLLYKEIAIQHNVSIDCVKKHAKNIYKKLGVRNKVEATNWFILKSMNSN